MTRPRTLSVVAVLGGATVALVFLRRGLGRKRDRVDLYFDDGSMLSLADGPDAERLLQVARSAL